MKKLFLTALIASALCSMIFASGGGEDTNATDPGMFADYTSWTKVNAESITGDTTGALGKAHEGTKGIREVYVNSAGEAVSFGNAAFPYPVGSIIVKESYKAEGGAKGGLSNSTIMIKRESGYDSENGDWEYAMLTAKGKVQSQGALGTCTGCHSAAADSDYVFTNAR